MRDFGVDLGQLYACYTMSPAERLDVAARSANGLAELQDLVELEALREVTSQIDAERPDGGSLRMRPPTL